LISDNTCDKFSYFLDCNSQHSMQLW